MKHFYKVTLLCLSTTIFTGFGRCKNEQAEANHTTQPAVTDKTDKQDKQEVPKEENPANHTTQPTVTDKEEDPHLQAFDEEWRALEEEYTNQDILAKDIQSITPVFKIYTKKSKNEIINKATENSILSTENIESFKQIRLDYFKKLKAMFLEWFTEKLPSFVSILKETRLVAMSGDTHTVIYQLIESCHKAAPNLAAHSKAKQLRVQNLNKIYEERIKWMENLKEIKEIKERKKMMAGIEKVIEFFKSEINKNKNDIKTKTENPKTAVPTQ